MENNRNELNESLDVVVRDLKQMIEADPVRGEALRDWIDEKLRPGLRRFVEARDGRGPGLGGLDLAVADRAAVLGAARERGCYVSDEQVDVCGTRFYLHDA